MSSAFSMATASKASANARMSDAFKSESGAFDLPSILVGVVVVGILTAGVMASIFGVIPFAQDKGAQQDLNSVVTAQGVYLAASTEQYGEKVNTYAENLGELAEPGVDLIGDKVAADGDIKMAGKVGDFVAVTESGSGKFYKVTGTDNTPTVVEADDLEAAFEAAKTAAGITEAPAATPEA
ncbi:hypothetical protein [Arthrobacter sp. zg-Y1110]|uniref:hypothetical protein n=1 Tax=Arthrobacter sp. zg-Y1110 TaxID=2886932 RepID=UPI001D143F7B|nr:hypothetical protein [Arthrobacter sp. zg-Y1110]MCC3292555.1 hypothetical protein [Arthrobacter sp. zg-Y1110]UWX87013.1 hypothetical protein N2K99_16820 [Arthrobacter sp. zg-Y1110]